MIYIDIDNTLADSDGYLLSLNPRAFEDIHLLFKTIWQNYQTVFLKSKPLVDLSFLKDMKKEDYTLLTSLPNKANIVSFCDNADYIMSVLKLNKELWVKATIGDCQLIILDHRADKIKFCKASTDILIDDSTTTGSAWKKVGGQYFVTVRDFLNRGPNTLNTVLLEEKAQLW